MFRNHSSFIPVLSVITVVPVQKVLQFISINLLMAVLPVQKLLQCHVSSISDDSFTCAEIVAVSCQLY